MSNYIVDGADLTSVANAIRTKGGTSAQLAFPAGFVSAIGDIPSGGGVTAATGEITLASDFALTTSPQAIPGLQLDFQPDFFVICMNRASFEAITTPGGGLYAVLAWRKNVFAPFSSNATTTPESDAGDYGFMITNALLDNSYSQNGKGLWGGFSMLGLTYYDRYAVNQNGTVSVGRYSGAGASMLAGTYRYFAFKI